jgi:hypothetical protein
MCAITVTTERGAGSPLIPRDGGDRRVVDPLTSAGACSDNRTTQHGGMANFCPPRPSFALPMRGETSVP